MPIDLTNATTIFRLMIHDLFRDFLDIFTVVYMDDIFIYLKTQNKHDLHVRHVQQQLREYVLYAKVDKCCFDHDQVEILRDVVSVEGIFMDPMKIQIVLD